MDSNHSPFSRFRLCALALIALAAIAPRARAQDSSDPGPSPHAANWRTTILEENDSLYFKSDKHYTQGFRLSFLSPVLTPGGWPDHVFSFFDNIPTVFADPQHAQRRVAWMFGQSIFTPKDLRIKPPDPRDRPYAGWLYVGPSLLQETGNQLENLELDVGIVGPAALGRQIQNDWHQFVGIHQAEGWSNQIQNEPGGMLSYERLWRVPVPFLNWGSGGVENGVDIVPQAGGTVGNIFDYAEIGAQLRIGHHLETDYGPVRVRPALSGTDYFNPAHLGDDVGWYFFAGTQGRAVARNLFLDGNSFRQSPHVEHKTLVADLEAGATIFWSDRIRLTLSAERRTREFVGQSRPDLNGTAAVSFSW